MFLTHLSQVRTLLLQFKEKIFLKEPLLVDNPNSRLKCQTFAIVLDLPCAQNNRQKSTDFYASVLLSPKLSQRIVILSNEQRPAQCRLASSNERRQFIGCLLPRHSDSGPFLLRHSGRLRCPTFPRDSLTRSGFSVWPLGNRSSVPVLPFPFSRHSKQRALL